MLGVACSLVVIFRELRHVRLVAASLMRDRGFEPHTERMLDAGNELKAPQHGTEGINTYVKPHCTA